ncbi:hypothetical protein DM02DRAFT_325926 [Periconia macrospinosa]|uniref:Uncharacterized protein n=1 Tax=Periconia macrospinosa TaxID=97972 RepID=A0A2V1EB66_9PLEO|nr:hypothetical protein DM02DRAFT_325926 [Periconia macrospinosa]
MMEACGQKTQVRSGRLVDDECGGQTRQKFFFPSLSHTKSAWIHAVQAEYSSCNGRNQQVLVWLVSLNCVRVLYVYFLIAGAWSRVEQANQAINLSIKQSDGPFSQDVVVFWAFWLSDCGSDAERVVMRLILGGWMGSQRCARPSQSSDKGGKARWWRGEEDLEAARVCTPGTDG